jgi:dipeptidyl aminopeptidase/acylaminoacyl peptidase
MADDRVRAAVEHWAPRVVAGGVDPDDFARITAAIESWDEWCAAWSEAAGGYERSGYAALAAGRGGPGAAQLSMAALYYHFAKFLFVHDPRQMRAAHAAAVRCLNAALPHLEPPGERIEIAFGRGVLTAVLRRPAGAGPHPLVVLIPGLDSAKEELRVPEQVFLDRGLATLAVDGPGQGEAEYDLPIRPDWESPGAAILDAVSGRPGIDPGRIGLWGVSLGGYYAPRLASADRRVRACIALSGPFSFGPLWRALPELTRAAFIARSGASGERDAIRRAGQLTLAGCAAGLTAPVLIIAGQRDAIVPWQHACQLREAVGGPAELLLLPRGNHGCANLPALHRRYSAGWMARQLAG